MVADYWENPHGSRTKTNHSWHVTLYVSSRGLTTSLIPHPSGAFEIEFNFARHQLEIRKVSDQKVVFDLEPMSVADFYHKTLDGLKQLNLETEIYPKPVELPDPILAFPKNTVPHLMMQMQYKKPG